MLYWVGIEKHENGDWTWLDGNTMNQSIDVTEEGLCAGFYKNIKLYYSNPCRSTHPFICHKGETYCRK